MAVQVGDQIPNVEVQVLSPEGAPETVQSGDILGSGKVVLVAVPGAFTPTCSNSHLPGYVQSKDELAAKGVDKVVVTSVNDPWVMGAWLDSQGADGIGMLADGNANFAEAMGLTMDVSVVGLATRSVRYAAVIEDGVITSLDVEQGGGLEVSTCELVIGKL